jgi:hypothetical protein
MYGARSGSNAVGDRLVDSRLKIALTTGQSAESPLAAREIAGRGIDPQYRKIVSACSGRNLRRRQVVGEMHLDGSKACFRGSLDSLQ